MEETAGENSKQAGRVVLAHEAPFRLGDLNVDPATLQVEQDGRRDTLEPRVMQVLVALARAKGGIVTRDELIEDCWDGRIVGEDAINRALSRVRHCAAGFAAGGFAVETIPRVGYRLVVGEVARSGADAEVGRPSEPSRSRRWILGAGAGAAAIAVAGTSLWRLGGEGERNPEAMKLYLHGMENRGQASLQQSEQSVSYFREATRIDPEFADAWGALAWGYRGLLAYGPRTDTARIEAQCRSAAKRALELDPANVEALSALLLLRPFYGRWNEVEQGCRRLLGRNPGNSILEYNLGVALCETGRWRDSIPILAAVARREPFWPLATYDLIRAMLSSGRIEEAEDLFDGASRRWPRRADFWMARHRMLLAADRGPEAASFAGDLSSRPVSDEPMIDMELVIARAIVASDKGGVERALSRLLDLAVKTPRHFLFAVTGAAMLGAVDTALEMIQGYFFGRGHWAGARADSRTTSFLFSASTRSLRADVRFAALVKEIGLSDYWHEAGRQPDFRRFP